MGVVLGNGLVAMIKIQLPYPNPKLSPNQYKRSWAGKARLAKAYRFDCCMIANSIVGPKGGFIWAKTVKLPVKITFHPPDKRRRDRDNMIAAFKSGQDGIVDAIGVDDADWIPSYEVGDVIKGGAVILEIGI
ncbi:MAG: hypothetical protein JKY52_08395 [Flavobacteriales bacterium]|nr:hypothetical protein [Flavobacteriales bacterium]